MMFCFFAAAKTRYRRHQLIDVRSNSTNLTRLHRGFDKFPGFFRLESFFFDYGFQFLFFSLRHKGAPLQHNIIHIVDAIEECFDKFFFAAEFRACV